MRRIVVTSAGSPLGLAMLAALRAMPGVEQVRGVTSTDKHARPIGEELEVVPYVPDHRPFAEYLEKESIDTVIQCGLVPDRSGLGPVESEADVIATMCLGAAIAQPGSTCVAGCSRPRRRSIRSGAHSSLMQVESQELRPRRRDPGVVDRGSGGLCARRRPPSAPCERRDPSPATARRGGRARPARRAARAGSRADPDRLRSRRSSCCISTMPRVRWRLRRARSSLGSTTWRPRD